MSPESQRIDIADTAAMTEFGRRLGKSLFSGAVVALAGPLGAGKTFLVRAVAEGLDIADGKVVSSPTFVLIQEYQARLPIYHFDAYRLASAEEFFDLGAHEYFAGDGVCLLEWADKVAPCLPPSYLEIRISVTGPTSRSLHITAHGTGYEVLLQRL